MYLKISTKKPNIKPFVDFLVSDQMLKVGDKVNLERLHHELISKDWFMTLLEDKQFYNNLF